MLCRSGVGPFPTSNLSLPEHFVRLQGGMARVLEPYLAIRILRLMRTSKSSRKAIVLVAGAREAAERTD